MNIIFIGGPKKDVFNVSFWDGYRICCYRKLKREEKKKKDRNKGSRFMSRLLSLVITVGGMGLNFRRC